MSTVLLPGNILYAGPSPTNEAKSCLSVGDYILKKLKSHGDEVLMINAVTDDRYTAKTIYNASIRLAFVLRHLGIKANDVIAICSENSIECIIAYIAALGINATVALLNVAYTERELKHAMSLVQPKLVFGSTKSMDRTYNIAKTMDSVKTLINLTSRKNTKAIYSFPQLMEDQSIPSAAEITPQSVNKDEDIALIFYSSGTTGQPKGVQLSHTNLLYAFDIALAARSMPGLKIALNVLPWCHVYGNMRLLIYFSLGRTQVYRAKATGQQILRDIERFKVNEVVLVPPQMVFLAKDPTVKDYDLSSLQFIICGAAAAKKEVVEEVKKRTNAVFAQGYGLTETTFGVIGNKPNSPQPDCIGTLKPDFYAKVVDPETGIALGFNQPGELCFKGKSIMKGYIGDPQATANTIRDDGWFHSGDIGYYNENFEFFIVDRLKELIKYKGNQVPPAELESILLGNQNILDAAVVGKLDDEAGELPMAFVVKAANSKITEKEIVDYVAERVAPMKRLRGGVVFVNEIPKTNTGKILRRELRKRIMNPKSKL